MTDQHPSEAELAFLNLAYPRFLNLFDEVMKDQFWSQSDQYRFDRMTVGFAIYSELLNYEPLKRTIEAMKSSRPPMEAEIGSELVKFVRNVLAHFPVFERWDDVWVSQTLVTWEKAGSIHKFLQNCIKHPTEVKYRFWNPDKKEMTYLQIRFPIQYGGDHKIFLKDIINERDGVRFCFILMRQILSTQMMREDDDQVADGVYATTPE
jgi:hypothetical protein